MTLGLQAKIEHKKIKGLEMLQAGSSAASVAKRLGVSTATATRWRVAAEIPPQQRGRVLGSKAAPHTPEVRNRALEMLRDSTRSMQEVASALEIETGAVVSISSLSNWQQAAGCVARTRGPKSDAEIEQSAIDAVLSGRHVPDVAEEVGVSESCVYRWLRDAGVERDRLPHPATKTERNAQVYKLRTILKPKDIALRFKISRSRVVEIIQAEARRGAEAATAAKIAKNR